jgi:hypothetical protein
MYPYKSTKEENEARKEHDYYSTPSDTTQALLNVLKPVMYPKLDVILEPACGEGKMSRVIRENGYKVSSSDAYEYEYKPATYNLDFLKMDATSCSWIITNPPFNLAEEFIRKAATISRPETFRGYAMLLKSNYWHAKSREPLFQDYTPSLILPLTWRPKFNETQKAPVLDMAWNVWLDEPDMRDELVTYAADSAFYIPLLKPEK